MERRLAAVLAADVVGYSRLMGLDESATLEALKQRRQNILVPLLAEHRGRLVKLMGDGVLVEFSSAVSAVHCALELQKRMQEANANLAQDRQIHLRIGINLGDVMVEGSDLYGEVVNVAARLEALADPGGIVLSQPVVGDVRNKVEAIFEDLGDQELKNIALPVRVYRIAGVCATGLSQDGPKSASKPTVAVLPFANLSGDPEQSYFSDGIAEDLLTELSRFRQLFVIARNSSFQYRGQEIDVRRVARELGVRFVVEGSTRKSGNRLRVAVQLIDAVTGNHIWAERYDRELEDVFTVQDEITQAIVSSLAGRIEEADLRRAMHKTSNDLTAYDLLLRGKHRLVQGSQEDVLAAREIFDRVRDMEPDNALAYVALAETYFYEVLSGWSADAGQAAAKLFECAQTAAKLDNQESRAHLCLAWGYWRVKGNLELALSQIDQAIALNPNDLENYCLKSWMTTCSGRLEEGILCTTQAIRRGPNLPEECLHTRVMAEYLLGRFAEAVATFGRMVEPPASLYGWVAACYAELGRMSEAKGAAEEFRTKLRAMDICPSDDDLEGWHAFWTKSFPAQDPSRLDQLFAGLRKAGLPA